MRRFIPCWIVLAIALAAPAWADEGDSRARIVDIRRAPPPPVITDREEPHLAPVPNTTVRVADRGERDFDLFRYGVFWYIHRDGFWYRGRGFRGPFTVVEVKYAPRAIINVPEKFWRHSERATAAAVERRREPAQEKPRGRR